MKCVGYDNSFQWELSERFPLWVPPKKRDGAREQEQDAPAKIKPKKEDKRIKRKREATPDELEYIDAPQIKACSVKRERKGTATAEAAKIKTKTPNRILLSNEIIEFTDDEEIPPSRKYKCNEGTLSSPICL